MNASGGLGGDFLFLFFAITFRVNKSDAFETHIIRFTTLCATSYMWYKHNRARFIYVTRVRARLNGSVGQQLIIDVGDLLFAIQTILI